jgi:hypothetical protein
MKGNSLIMKTGDIIPIAHRAAGDIKKKYLEYFFKGGTE